MAINRVQMQVGMNFAGVYDAVRHRGFVRIGSGVAALATRVSLSGMRA